VAAGRAPGSLLDSYHAQRPPVARAVLRTTDGFTRLATLENRWCNATRAISRCGGLRESNPLNIILSRSLPN
jgi:2-polyprenyl-6-methoxyphenol hydroxylase-like FAD-dependent oxidoreductase